MSHVCHEAVSVAEVSNGDPIFHAGEKPKKPSMYFLIDGELKYVAMDGRTEFLVPGTSISEAVLWTTWRHLGVLVAISEARLTLLDATNFAQIVQRFAFMAFSKETNPRVYAVRFVEKLNALQKDHECQVDDLFTVCIDADSEPLGLMSRACSIMSRSTSRLSEKLKTSTSVVPVPTS
jgi:CRP-like cAMP-binding protein